MTDARKISMTSAKTLRSRLREAAAMALAYQRAEAARQYRVARGGDRTRAWKKLRDATNAALRVEVSA